MAASMLLPTFAAIGLLATDTDIGALLIAEHVAMLLSMLAAMLLRPAEYAHRREVGLALPAQSTPV